MSVQPFRPTESGTSRPEPALGAAILPSKAWILGIVVEPARKARTPAAGTPPRRFDPSESTAVTSDCTCPDFCERDHANE